MNRPPITVESLLAGLRATTAKDEADHLKLRGESR